MKPFTYLLLAGWILLSASLAPAADNLSATLQKALFEEEANHNLEAAIKAYQSVVQQGDEQRKLTATALFRLGECYRKLGRTNEAAAQYQRLLRDFNDQPTLANLSQQNLLGLGLTTAAGAKPAETAAATDEEEKEIRRIQALIQNSPDLINTPGTNSLTPLQQAATAGYVSVARFLLANKADVNAAATNPRRNVVNSTALHMAARNGNKGMVELLLDHGADVNAVGEAEYTKGAALHFAAKFGYQVVAEVLLAHKADVNLSPDGGSTPLGLAAQSGNKALVELLLQHGADVNAKTKWGWTPMHSAAQGGNAAIAELLFAHKAAVDSKANDGTTPLSAAVGGGQLKVVEFLLKNGVEVEAMEGSGLTPLQKVVTRAGYDPHAEIIRLLLKAGADPNRPFNATGAGQFVRLPNLSANWDTTGSTPLVVCSYLRDAEAVEALLAGGANVNAKSSEGKTPLLYAVEAKSGPMVDAILARSPDLEVRDRTGCTALARAIESKEARIAEKLIKAGANVNTDFPTTHGTLLHFSVDMGRKEFVELLVTNQAQVNIVNRSGLTPLDFAKNAAGNLSRSDHLAFEEIAAFLVQHGAEENFTRRSFITVARPLSKFSRRVFPRGTNDWNRYTLLELFATVFANPPADLAKSLAFPDLSRVTIQRLNPADAEKRLPSKETRDLVVDIDTLLKSGDCAQAPWLEWGDIVNIPEQDHPVNETWNGLAQPVREALVKCLRREVELVIKGQSRKAILEPSIRGPSALVSYDAVQMTGLTMQFGEATAATGPLHLDVLRLNDVLRKSGLLRVSSDLSRVRVTRSDQGTQEPAQCIINLSPGQPFDAATDLWLRDGDLIEVPEKGEAFAPVAPRAKPAPAAPSAAPSAVGEGWERRADSPLAGRNAHTAVWTGRELLVFGGQGPGVAYGDGASYDPATDIWSMLPAEKNSPHGRTQHTAVWTGKEMILWGGYGGRHEGGAFVYNTGARFDPSTRQWKSTSTEGAPTPRFDHTAVWTGKEMIIWGGYSDVRAAEADGRIAAHLNDGARYDPATDTWKPLASAGAPSPRYNHTAVWTGTHMIIWGGGNATTGLNDGAMYDPLEDAWSPLPTAGAPQPRLYHAAIWTGSEMIIFGGRLRDMSGNPEDAARFNPRTGQWQTLPSSEARSCVIWNGAEMLTWSGEVAPNTMQFLNTGARFNPARNAWSPMEDAGAPAARALDSRSAAWIGDGLLFFGGWNGKYYNDTWLYRPSK